MSTQFILQSAVNFPVALWVESSLSAYQGCPSEPIKLYMYTEDNLTHRVNLYAQGSNSIPYQVPQNKWSHLNPQWRFTNLSGDVITELTLDNASQTTFDGTTGYLASAEFLYMDDMPTLPGQNIFIWAVADFMSYPVYSDTTTNSPTVSGFSNSNILTALPFIITELEPEYLSITRDGINPMFDFYWKNTVIPYVITVMGTTQDGCSAILKNYPLSGMIGPINQTITDISSSLLTWSPSITNAYLSALDDNNFVVGGYLRSSVLSEIDAPSVIINATLSALSGSSKSFNIYDFNGFDIRRFNESWDASNEIKKFARSPHIADNPVLWDKYMKAVWGDESSTQGSGFGRESYEKIANFVPNHVDINVCNIDQLYSLAEFTDVPIDIYGISLPPELKRIMDIASINQQQLWGSRCKCSRNITNTYTTFLSGSEIIEQKQLCKVCGHEHPGNKGELFNPTYYTVSAFTPFIIEDRTSSNYRYQLVTPPALAVSAIEFNSSCFTDTCSTINTNNESLTTYPLSGYYNILLPPVFDYSLVATWSEFQEAVTHFCFYTYIPSYCTEQIAGVINWDDTYTTLEENLSSTTEWYGSGQTLERMINCILHKGLGLIEE